MRSLGGLLFFLGAGSVVLHLLGREFLVLAPLTPYQPWAGIVVAIIGAVLIFAGERSDRRVETETVNESRADDADVETWTTTTAGTTGTVAHPPASGPMSSPVGYGPPAESGAAPGTATTSAPGEATTDADRGYGTTTGRDTRPDPTAEGDRRP